MCCNRQLLVLKALISVNLGPDRQLLIKFYYAFLKSKIEKAIQLFGSISKQNLRPLEVIQNQKMRIMTGLRMLTPISLQIECKITSISNHISFIISKNY